MSTLSPQELLDTLKDTEKELNDFPEKGGDRVDYNKTSVEREFKDLKKDMKDNPKIYIDKLIKENISLKKEVAIQKVKIRTLEGKIDDKFIDNLKKYIKKQDKIIRSLANEIHEVMADPMTFSSSEFGFIMDMNRENRKEDDKS